MRLLLIINPALLFFKQKSFFARNIPAVQYGIDLAALKLGKLRYCIDFGDAGGR
jgi:hypothetical protein